MRFVKSDKNMKSFKCETCFLCLILCFSVLQTQELDESEGGDFLFLSKNDELAEELHLPGKGKAKSNCEHSVLSNYLAWLQIINPESVIALAIKHKLESKCHNISKTIDHMESYLKTCNLAADEEQFVLLLKAVKALHKKLCTNNPYHKAFMEHKKCYGQLQTEVGDTCNGPADWTDSSEAKQVCRAYQEIRDCYYIKASVLCGNKAADIFKELVQCIIESVITVDCSVVTGGEETPPKKSKEQQLMLQKEKLANTKTKAQVTTRSSQTLCVSRPQHLLTLLTIACLTKLVEFVVQNHRANSGAYIASVF